MFDVWCLLLFGIVGLLIKKFHFPVSCFLIGFILGGDLEDYFIQVLTAYNGSLTGLFVRPMSWVIWALIILSVVYAVLDNPQSQAPGEGALRQAVIIITPRCHSVRRPAPGGITSSQKGVFVYECTTLHQGQGRG